MNAVHDSDLSMRSAFWSFLGATICWVAALLGRAYPLHQDFVQRIIIRRIPSYSLLMTNGYHIIWTDTMFIVMRVGVEVAESNRMFSISTRVSSSLTVPTASDLG